MTSTSTSSSEMESAPQPSGELPAAASWLQAAEPWGELDPAPLPQVVITAAALEDVRRHAESDLRVELGGTLLGNALRHEGRSVVVVEAAIPARSSEHSAVHFTFTADAWRQLNQDREEQFPDLQTVGWFHTHPNLGVFYSSDDVVVHSAAFTQPWHIGLVVDPIAGEMAFFGWTRADDARTLAPLRGCHFLAQEELPPPAWRIAPRAAVWAHRDEASVAAALSGDKVYGASLPPLAAAAAPWIGLSVGLIGLLALIAVYVLGMRPLQRNVAALEALTAALAAQQLAAANADGAAECLDPRLQILAPAAGVDLPAGAELPIVGTSAVAGAARYEVAARPAGSSTWEPFATYRGTAQGEILGIWSAPLPSGQYELRLRALAADGSVVAADAACRLTVTIVNSGS